MNNSMIIQENMTIADAMKVIDMGGCRAAFLVVEGILKGVLTDGDIRRFLLSGGDINESVIHAINRKPIFVYEQDNIDYREYMLSKSLVVLPIVDENMHLMRIETMTHEVCEYSKIEDNVRVVMMAGGLGTRLKPYTDIIPKPLIPIGTKSITERIFDKFLLYGISNFNMVVNYKKSLIEAYFKEINVYNGLDFTEETSFLGTAGGIKLLKNTGNSHFFLINCDIYIDYDYSEIWDFHKKNDNFITIVTASKKICVPYGTVHANAQGEVLSLIEKPTLEYNINTGMYVCSPKIIDYIENGERIDMPDLIKRCMDSGEKVGQFLIGENAWYDMGQPDELENMKRKLI